MPPGMLSKSSWPGLQILSLSGDGLSVLTAPAKFATFLSLSLTSPWKGKEGEQGTTIKRMTEPGHNKDWLEATRPNGAKDLTSNLDSSPNIAWQIPCCSLVRPWTGGSNLRCSTRTLTAWGTKWVLSQASTFAVTCYVAIGNRERLCFLPCCCCCC